MKKGQVTIFILIFVVLLIGFGFVFYLLNQVAQDTTRSSQQALIEEIKAKTTLEQQMKECLNVGLKRGLRLIGSQGGFIYKDQQVTDPYYGLLNVGASDGVDLPSSWRHDPASTGYGIPIYLRQPTYKSLSSSPAVDSGVYPYTHVALSSPDYPCLSPASTGVLAGVTIDSNPARDCRKIYDASMVTRSLSLPLWNDQSLGVSFPELGVACSGDCNGTVKSNLERYAGAYFEKCFTEITVPGFDVGLEGSAKMTADFSTTTVNLVVEPNLTVHGDSGDFSFSFPAIPSTSVLFKADTFFGVFSTLMTLEAIYPHYDLIEGFDSITALHDTMIVTGAIDSPTYQVIISLSGRDANIFGEPFVFVVRLSNRIPVLLPIVDMHDASSGGDLNDGKLKVCAADPDYEFSVDDMYFSISETIYGVMSFSSEAVDLNPPENMKCMVYEFTGSCTIPGSCSQSEFTVTVTDGFGKSDWQSFRVVP